ncbi:MAG: S1 RNA-binding domain-containing protein [Chloroflexi bacterium]|nr:S1 RNA-binding domain-containing protein [Chloroflexota bacterium]
MTSDPTDQTGGTETSSAEPMDMATLLAEAEDFRTPQRGEITEGVIMGWDRDGALVDIGAKSEGVILRHEMQSLGSDPESQLQEDTKVMVYIVHPETADGQILLSLDKARGEQGWLTLQERFDSGEAFEAEVSGFNKGGLLVNVEGVNAFVPLSQVVGVRPDRNREDGESSLGEVVGKSLRLKVIEINRRRNRVILSERAALQEWRMAQKERLIQELNEGDIRKGRISSVRNFGVFVDLGGADGLAHLSELSWDRDKSPTELFKVGDEVEVYITKIDAENKKIALSVRRANPEQWENVVNKYDEGQVVTGLVTKLVTFGAFARIEGPVEGLIHVSELVDRRIGHPRDVVREGDLLPLKIVRIERDRHRLGLSLRRARDEGEAMGYVFSEGGEVINVPEEIRTEFVAREGPIPEPTPEAGEQIEDRAGTTATADAPASGGDSSVESDTAATLATAEEETTAAPAEEPVAEAEAVAPATETDTDDAPAAEAEEASAAEEESAEQPEAAAAEEPADEPEEPAVEAEEAPAAEEESAKQPEASIAEEPTEQADEPEEPAVEAEQAPAAEEESAERPEASIAEEQQDEPAEAEEQAEEEDQTAEDVSPSPDAPSSPDTTSSSDETSAEGEEEEETSS